MEFRTRLGKAIFILASAAASLPGIRAAYLHYSLHGVSPAPLASAPAKDCKPLSRDDLGLRFIINWDEFNLRKAAEEKYAIEGMLGLDLDGIVDGMLPHVASVIQQPRVNKVRMALDYIRYADGRYYPELNGALIHENLFNYSSRLITVTSLRGVVAHELMHGQELVFNQYRGNLLEALRHAYGFRQPPNPAQARFLDEAFTELASMEVLARMALEGDKTAEHSFAVRVGSYLSKYMEFHGEFSSRAEPPTRKETDYYLRPAAVVRDVASCRSSGFMGVKLLGIRALIEYISAKYDEVAANPNK